MIFRSYVLACNTIGGYRCYFNGKEIGLHWYFSLLAIEPFPIKKRAKLPFLASLSLSLSSRNLKTVYSYREHLSMCSISGFPVETSRKRKIDVRLDEMLVLLKNAALDPCHKMHGSNKEWKARVLKSRKTMFLRSDDVSSFDPKDFPYWKKMKNMHKFSSSIEGRPTLATPIRRSTRTVLNLGDGDIFRKRIPVGPSFQAEVPDWTCSPKYDVGDTRFLGTRLWPKENNEKQISNEVYVKPRSYPCNCANPGSEKCIKLHVSMARLHLKSDLGCAFFDMGFSEMGEEVSKSWTHQEQIKFDELVKENRLVEGKVFMEPALEHFTSKTRRDIVSFYHNVHILRCMSFKSRYETLYTSDDECLGWEKEG